MSLSDDLIEGIGNINSYASVHEDGPLLGLRPSFDIATPYGTLSKMNKWAGAWGGETLGSAALAKDIRGVGWGGSRGGKLGALAWDGALTHHPHLRAQGRHP